MNAAPGEIDEPDAHARYENDPDLAWGRETDAEPTGAPEPDDDRDALGRRGIAVAGAVFGVGLAGIMWFWRDVVTPLVGGDPLVLAALVLPTAVIAVAALEAGLLVGKVAADA